MLRLVPAFLVLFAVGLAPAQKPDAAKDELKKFAGTWKIKEAERGGEKMPEDRRDKMRLKFDGDKVTTSGGTKDNSGVLKLDTAKTPAEFDIEDKEGGKTIKGIYKFEKEILTLCLTESGDRPKAFKSDEKNVMLLTLEKAK